MNEGQSNFQKFKANSHIHIWTFTSANSPKFVSYYCLNFLLNFHYSIILLWLENKAISNIFIFIRELFVIISTMWIKCTDDVLSKGQFLTFSQLPLTFLE